MSRTYTPGIRPEERDHLYALLASTSDVPAYRRNMRALGHDLGRRLLARLDEKAPVLLVCTAEDADFLARGMLDVLTDEAGRAVTLICFWNHRQTVGGTKIAPIIRRYEEPLPREPAAVVVVKSIISGACVVRTNLLEVLEILPHPPRDVIVAAPVILEGAPERLNEQFPADRSFEFLWLAADSVREPDGTVRPGVGGSVYELYGFADQAGKNRHRPELVRRRNLKLLA